MWQETLLLEFSWFFLNFNDQKFILGVRPGSTQMCFGLWESVGVCGHVISLLSLCECVWVFNNIVNLAPYAQGQIAVMGKAEGHWKNKLGLLKERWLKGEFSCKVARGFSIRENFQCWLESRGTQGVHLACLCHFLALAGTQIAL